jgi:two-component system nitrate/nitrite sensor histidine kinase NarX
MGARLSLSKKLFAVGSAFLLASLVVIGVTAWASSRLDRALAIAADTAHLRADLLRLQVTPTEGAAPLRQRFADDLSALKTRSASGGALWPWRRAPVVQLDGLDSAWRALQQRGNPSQAAMTDAARLPPVAAVMHELDRLGYLAEQDARRWSGRVRLLPLLLVLLTAGAAGVFLWLGHIWVVAPVDRLRRGFERLRAGEFGARVEVVAGDEMGRLAADFNLMARALQTSRSELERKVHEKTAGIAERNEHLAALYAVSALAAEAPDLETLSRGFVEHIRRAAGCDGAALRWSDESNENYLLLATDGVPDALIEHERHLPAGACACCQVQKNAELRVVSVTGAGARLPHCRQAGFRTVVSVPLEWQQRIMGEVTLFYRANVALADATRGLLSVMGRHLASAMESLRVAALEREAMVTAERKLIARELHDSIAQSLAFLKIQAGLLRGALDAGDTERRDQSLAELDAGIRECLADVRELLVHFRTRTQDEDIEGALRATLSKFEHQSGIKARFDIRGHGLPLAPDVQIQVLHLVQEALSNVRKHSGAKQVELRVQRQPRWRFEVRDDGRGFDPDSVAPDSVHVGLDIMRERARRVGAALHVISAPGSGTRVLIELAAGGARPAPAPAAREQVPALS